jgi:hypothetical protein
MENPKINIPDDCVYKVQILNSQNETSKVILYSRNNVYSSEQETQIYGNISALSPNAEMIYSTQQLLLDDSIRIIKKKILMDLWENTNLRPSYDELYLFGYHQSPYSIQTIFMNAIEQQERETPGLIERNKLYKPAFEKLLNHMGLNDDSLGVKEFVTLSDLEIYVKPLNIYNGTPNGVPQDVQGQQLPINQLKGNPPMEDCSVSNVYQCKSNNVFLSTPIGPVLSTSKKINTNITFHANPYETRDAVSQLNPQMYDYFENKLLLNYGILKQNAIYVCLAEDVLSHYSSLTVPKIENYMNTYFRILYNKNIRNTTDLLQSRDMLEKETQKILDAKSFKLYNAVQVFHDIYHSRKTNIGYSSQGINSFYLQILPDFHNILPLEIIFKSIHTSQIIPLIKYNPGERREKIYRLYYEKTSRNGKKIPYLKDKMILKLTREMGKSGQISIYLTPPSSVFAFYIHFELNGKISIECELKQPMLESDINILLKQMVNPVLIKMNAFLEKVGFNIPLYESLRSANIDVVNMKYSVSTKIVNKINLKSLACIYSVFNVYNDKIDDEALLRFKRVENYQEMDAKTVFISEKRNNIPELLTGLINNFQMTENDAKLEVAKFFDNYADMNGEVFSNPGFPVKLRIAKLEDVLEIEVENIVSIKYLDVIHIYLDSLIRITQQPRSSGVSKEYFTHLCSKTDLAHADKSHIPNSIETAKQSHIPSLILRTEDDLEPVTIPMEEEEDVGVFFEDEFDELEGDGEENIDEMVESFNENIKELEGTNGTEKPQSFLASLIPTALVTSDVPVATAAAKLPPSIPTENSQSSEDAGVYFSDEDTSQDGGDDDVADSVEGEGEDDNEKYKKNPTGMSLNNPNPFLKRMKQRDPTLFLTKKTGKYKSYSTNCQPINRQPVILTNEEKLRIDTEFPGSYHNAAIQYGTDPKNKYWYVCPRYWCFLTNSSISEEDVKAGKCGRVIPDGATKIPEGAYVYEFKTEDHFDEKGKYIQHYPGFALKPDLHPDGNCLPCCFKNWNTGKQKERKEQCMKADNAVEPGVEPPKAKPSLYIISLDTYPLDQGRWGFLPIAAQLFVGSNYAAAVDKNNNKLIQQNTPVMLRYGVEQSKNQSFMGVFADVYSYMQRINTPTITQFKQLLKQNVTLDIFVKIHNSSLISVFKPRVLPNVRYENYSNTELYKKIDLNNDHQKLFFRETIGAYNQFIKYLMDDTQPIDHTYLWDLFTMNIPTLNKGINLVLLEVISNDITEKIEVVCPVNSYSANVFDTKRDTVIVLKHDEFYEPVYMYKVLNDNIEPQKTFSEKTLYHNVKQMLLNVKYAGKKYCAPLQSLPKVFVFRPPILKEDLMDYLSSKSVSIEKQVLNYQGKVIGLVVNMPKESTSVPPPPPEAEANESQEMISVFVPCQPSAPTNTIPTVYMDDITIWTDYETTRNVLQKLHRESGAKIPAKPVYKVIEDGLIVGIITETYQFIQVNPPAENVFMDNLLVLNNTNLNEMDKVITTSNSQDKKRTELVKHIYLETQFYATFRNTIRKLINQFDNNIARDKIVKTIDNPALLYSQKLELVVSSLRTLAKEHIVFEDIENAVLMDLNDITECSNYTPENSPYCIVKDGVYQLILPKKHLISGYENNSIYFERLSDELVRYGRVRLFMLQPKEYSNSLNIDYRVAPNEFIIIHTLLSSEYFRDLEVFNANNNVANTAYEFADPSISQTYANDTITLAQQTQIDEQGAEIGSVDCVKKASIPIVGNTLNIWVKSFPKTAREMVYHGTPNCTYQVVMDILKDRIKKNVSINDVKMLLWKSYSTFTPNYLDKIVGMLKQQGKMALMESVYKRKTTMEALIMSEGYPLSDLDIWMLATTFQLPIILITSTFLKGVLGKVNWLKLGGKMNDKYYFVRSTLTSERNQVGEYHLIYPNFHIQELGEFNTMMQKAIQGDPEYTKCIVSLAETLEKIEFITRRV